MSRYGQQDKATVMPATFGEGFQTLEQRLAPLTGRALRNKADQLYIWKVVAEVPYYVNNGGAGDERMFRRHKDKG